MRRGNMKRNWLCFVRCWGKRMQKENGMKGVD
jgi:hypothetical protein